MEKDHYQPNQLYQGLDELIQENLDLSIKLHIANKDVGKLKLEVMRLETKCSPLIIKLEESNDDAK